MLISGRLTVWHQPQRLQQLRGENACVRCRQLEPCIFPLRLQKFYLQGVSKSWSFQRKQMTIKVEADLPEKDTCAPFRASGMLIEVCSLYASGW